MSSLDEFESTLKEVVQARRLSASKMTKLTDIAVKSMEHDTKLVAILYRTHKSLPASAKVSSLYAFDALARAARNQVAKHNITGDVKSEHGNAATFLLKIEGVLDGLIHDMITSGGPEGKEKTKKVLDIWIKSNTFPSAILTRLRDLLKETEKEADVKSTTVADPRATNPVFATPPTQTPTNQSNTPPITDPVQSTLLALLSQAVNAAPSTINGQTNVNTESLAPSVPAPQLDQAQLALLQRLAQTAKLASTVSTQPVVGVHLNASPPLQSSTSPDANSGPIPAASGGPGPNYNDRYDSRRREPRYNKYDTSGRGRERDSYHEDRYESRGGFRGGFRGRGRGRWEDRDRFRDRDRDRQSPPRPRRSRSRSPRRYTGKRDVQPYSPPHRPSIPPAYDPASTRATTSAAPDAGKDEFGRDIRPPSPKNIDTASVDASPTQPPVAPSVEVAPAITNYHTPVSTQLPSVAANTSQSHDAQTSSSMMPEQGLESFDSSTFDFTSPSSWEALGKMWQVSNGYLPSQEELFQFVMACGAVNAATMSNESGRQTGSQWSESEWGAGHTWRGGRGRGHGNPRGGRGGSIRYGNYRDSAEQYGSADTAYEQSADQYDVSQQQNFSGDGREGSADTSPQSNVEIGKQDTDQGQASIDERAQNGAGGRMQRVGDKWIFVRDLASGVIA